MSNLIRKLFQYSKTNEIPIINESKNRFIIDIDKGDLLIDINGKRYTLSPINENNIYKLSGGIPITAGTDLDTITEIGNYFCEKNTVALSLINCPSKNAFTMKVENGNGTRYPCQVLREFSTGTVYYRMYNNDPNFMRWYDWTSDCKGIISEKNSITLQNCTNSELFNNAWWRQEGIFIHTHIGVDGLTGNTRINIGTLPTAAKPDHTVIALGCATNLSSTARLSIGTNGALYVVSDSTAACIDAYHLSSSYIKN